MGGRSGRWGAYAAGVSGRVERVEGFEGLTLAVEQEGPVDGRPVILLHGGGQTRHAWGSTATALADRGWSALRVDLRGHGDSDWAPDGGYDLDHFAGDITVLAEAQSEPPVLVGASLGGISSLVALGDRDPGAPPLASALVLVDVAPRIEPAGVKRIGTFMTSHPDGFASLEEAADHIAAYNPNRPRPKDLSGLRKNLRQRDDGRWVWHWDPKFLAGLGPRGEPDEPRAGGRAERLAAAARTVTIPTLLVRGRQSDLLSEEGARDLLALIPHARMADVSGAGHMVAGDRNDLFNDAVLDFLDQL